MKKIAYYFIIFTVLISCKKEQDVINGNTSLKNLPQQVFTPNSTSKIKMNDTIFEYHNTFKKLPNTEFSKFHLKKHAHLYMPYFNVTVNLSENKKITIDGAELLKEDIIVELKDYIDFASEGKQTRIHLNIDEELSFANFYQLYKAVKPIETKNIQINNHLFIYNKKLLPDCDCSL